MGSLKVKSLAQRDERRQALEEARRLRKELGSLTPVAAELETIRLFGGKPIIRGMRSKVENILALLDAGGPR